MWDERYSTNEYVYGEEPNDFLAGMAHHLPAGEVLCLAEGEGRNSVYLAEQGYRVTGVDASAVGMEKAAKLASKRGVSIETHVCDLAQFELQPASWDGIVSIFCHVPPELRRQLHRDVVNALKPGGVLILEAYTPAQLALGTGGPKQPELTMTLDGLKQELEGLTFLHGVERQRDVTEGQFHTGTGAVVQVVARKDK